MAAARRIGALVAAVMLAAPAAARGELRFDLVLDPGNIQRMASPVVCRLEAGRDISASEAEELSDRPSASVLGLDQAKGGIPAQAEVLRDGRGDVREVLVRFMTPRLVAGRTSACELRLDSGDGPRGEAFRLRERRGYVELLQGSQPVFRHMVAFDPARREETYKPFHHVFGLKGMVLITKGPGGLYSHHRGLFLGWNKVGAGKETYDFWHCPNVHIRHAEYIPEREHLGPVAGRTSSVAEWRDPNGNPVVRETREVTAWRAGEGRTILDFEIVLKSATGRVELDGDAHHAGFHFRAAQEVAERKEETVYIRPRAARGGENDVWENCPWVTCLFSVKGESYAVTHMDHPDNPRPAVFSTRDYGRFGPFCKAVLEPGSPLRLRYRILVGAGEGSDAKAASACAAAYGDFISPVKVSVRRLSAGGSGECPTDRLPVAPPAKASVLFDGSSTEEWVHRDGAACRWPLREGAMETSGGDIMTKREFRDFMLHLEFLCPKMPPEITGQKRSNSGVYIQRRYEVQILDSYGLEAGKGDCGAIYNYRAPAANACLPPGSWQYYDITFRSPRWSRSGEKTENARISVCHNGQLIHDDVEVPGKTGAGEPEGPSPGPILLQDHGDDVLFRNVWIVPIGEAAGAR